MTENKKNGRRRAALAAIAALGLAAMGVFGAGAANAAAIADMPTEDGSLTIHKYEQPTPAGAENNTGEEIAVDPSWVPLNGVQFQVQEITDVDLTTEGGWTLANTYADDPTSIPGGSLTTVTTVTTASGGIATIATLPVGAYLVTELVSTGVTDGAGNPVMIVDMAAPFVVTVPIPTGDGTWNSDVHVYPKNSLTAVEKEVSEPTGPGLGETVTWTINVQIPTLEAGEDFTEFHITDNLDERLEFVGPARVTAGGDLIAFTGTHTGANGDGYGGTVTITIDDLVALAAAQGETLSVEIDTIVRGVGEIPNDATVYINEPTTGTGVGIPPAQTNWGALEITKHAAGDEAALLSGAVFSVYPTEADALARTNAIAVDVDGTPTTLFETDDNGGVTIPGLYTGTGADLTQTYWLVEIEAPDGYVLIDTPIEVEITADDVTPVELLVPNPQELPVRLPLTGADGQVIMVVGGIALLAVAAGLIIVARRRTARR